MTLLDEKIPGSLNSYCNLCHPDAHKWATLPVEEGLKEILKGELTQGQPNANFSNLHTLEDVRAQLCEVAEKLVYAMRIGDMDTFNHMTNQLRPLLRKEKRLRKEGFEQVVETFKAVMQPAVKDFATRVGEATDGWKITEIFFDFENERIAYSWEKEGEVHTSQWFHIEGLLTL